MIGEQIRSELYRPLEGDRSWHRLEQGQFTLRQHPEHIATIMAERARLRVEADLALYRRTLTFRCNAPLLELTDVSDPFEGFHDADDFGDFC